VNIAFDWRFARRKLFFDIFLFCLNHFSPPITGGQWQEAKKAYDKSSPQEAEEERRTRSPHHSQPSRTRASA
jgi:hypothetical protein